LIGSQYFSAFNLETQELLTLQSAMIIKYNDYLFKDREISWLNFNNRVLQEAADASNPIMERLKFLAIFSSNLDEFFRVRVAQLRKIQGLTDQTNLNPWQAQPSEIISQVQKKVVELQTRFSHIYENQILPELAQRKIFIINELHLHNGKGKIVEEYFKQRVLPYLFPILIDDLKQLTHLSDRSIYLAVKMFSSTGETKAKHAIVEIPTKFISRFYQLPRVDENTFIILLEDVIRANLGHIFNIFNFDEFDSYIFKITRDAELNVDYGSTEFSDNIIEKIQIGVKKRSKGIPTRFVYDRAIPEEFLSLLLQKIRLSELNLIPGSRYHNFKDFIDFPKVGEKDDYFKSGTAIPIRAIEVERTVFDAIKKQDIFLHHPYNSFDYIIRLLREAALDPKVTTIKISLYRVARHSNVVNALINAVKNGKKVKVLMELQARFDEESNIYWTSKLQEAGAQVYFGKPNQKVHCKLCLITRKEGDLTVRYGHLATGNYNGVTARQYSDIGLLTANPDIINEITKVFNVLFNASKDVAFEHLLVSPFNMKSRYIELIDTEIKNIKEGKPAYIKAKMNALVDTDMIIKLYDASKAGVKIDLIVRGVCCLVPGVIGLSENIRIISILDRLLEHSRVFIFCNGGDEKIFVSSADWMTRNLQNRIESAFPIYDNKIKKKINDIINIQFSDNSKARIIDGDQDSAYIEHNNTESIKAQETIYLFLKNLHAEEMHQQQS